MNWVITYCKSLSSSSLNRLTWADIARTKGKSGIEKISKIHDCITSTSNSLTKFLQMEQMLHEVVSSQCQDSNHQQTHENDLKKIKLFNIWNNPKIITLSALPLFNTHLTSSLRTIKYLAKGIWLQVFSHTTQQRLHIKAQNLNFIWSW